MTSEGTFSCTRPRGRSSCTRPGGRSSCVVPGGFERDGVAPKCSCSVYAILYKSRTTTNPNRMFLRCPFFKAKERHCRFVVLLDEHLKKIRAIESEAFGPVDDAKGIEVEEQLFRRQELEKNGEFGEEAVIYVSNVHVFEPVNEFLPHVHYIVLMMCSRHYLL
ncbi:hypothetical protein Ahy_B09g098729 [Arachis hypogaea]|uniref:Zinc finger GRF-type domain-containing protein n=1 Tax=Arachis hypogaea TaxID=3818 RepID=A0A444XRW8_ARAHY|nr:hypothetical protein Ahy_B09g098729 [Arachis hypogaea]